MAHIGVSPPSGASNISPLSTSFLRSSKDGNVSISMFLLGSHFNGKIDGEMSIDQSGNITAHSAKAVGGKLELALQSVDGTSVTKQASFVSFMYFIPGLSIVGALENQDASISGTEKIAYIFQDLATSDKLTIELSVGGTVNTLKLIETVSGVDTTLATQALSSTKKAIDFHLGFRDEGLSNFYFKETGGVKTRIFSGNIAANIAECKATCIVTSTQTSTKTCKSDYIWLFYKNLFLSYDVEVTNRLFGKVKIWDDMNDAVETNWREVYSSDHKFVGKRVIENGLIRVIIKTTPAIEVLGWTGSAWATIDNITPVSSIGDLATGLQDVVFDVLNYSQVKAIVKFGIVDHIIDMRRGCPYIRDTVNSTKFRITTSKARFALSVDTPSTQLQNFNQEKSDDTNRGNPLNLATPIDPYVFTNDSNVDTGLLLLDDNWFAWYNIANPTMVGYLGVSHNPTGLIIKATSASALNYIQWTFAEPAVVGIGVIYGSTSTTVNGVPTLFVPGNVDDNVKWRAGEGIYSFNQRMFLRRKR